MESLSEQQREQIRKMSDDRLRDNLRKAGMPEAAIIALDRPSLLAAWAELVATGRDKPAQGPGALAMPPLSDPDLEKRRLDFEERKWAEELDMRRAEIFTQQQMRQAELDAQQALRQAELHAQQALRKEELDAQQALREAELAAQHEQIKLESEKIKLEQERLRMQSENTDSPAAQMKRYGDALRGALGRMPTESTDLPAFFDNAERLFRNISAPHGFRAQLLMPYLTDKARALVGRMDPSKSSDYNEVKSLILREFKLTPWAYLKRYQTTAKTSDETYTMFVGRLHTLLQYYLNSRHVAKFEDLVLLFIADHVKSTLQSFREVVETNVMDKSFDNIHVAAIHHEMADLS